MSRLQLSSTLFPYTTLFRSCRLGRQRLLRPLPDRGGQGPQLPAQRNLDRRRPQRRNPQFRHREDRRSEEHTSELQSPCNVVCRLLLERKKENVAPIDKRWIL